MISSNSLIYSKLVFSSDILIASRTDNNSFANLVIANCLSSSKIFLYLATVALFSLTWLVSSILHTLNCLSDLFSFFLSSSISASYSVNNYLIFVISSFDSSSSSELDELDDSFLAFSFLLVLSLSLLSLFVSLLSDSVVFLSWSCSDGFDSSVFFSSGSYSFLPKKFLYYWFTIEDFFKRVIVFAPQEILLFIWIIW